MSQDFAIVLPEETVHEISEGRVQGKVGVCVVRGGEGSAYVVWPGTVASIVDGLPVAPSTDGFRVALPDVADEREALDLLMEAIRGEDGRIALGTPSGFIEAEKVHAHGLSLVFGEEGADVRVSRALATRLGWLQGDVVRMSLSSDGSTLALHCDDVGGSLVPCTGGGLEVSSYLVVPYRFRDLFTDWFSPAYWVSGGRIFFDVSEIPMAAVAEREDEEEVLLEQPPRWRPVRFVDGFLIGAAAASVASVATLLF